MGMRAPEPPTLGSLMRSLRDRMDWTLKEMSERTDIPVSTLSKVEHDRLTLSYDRLAHIAQRLNMPMSDLFADPAHGTEPAITARRSIGRIEGAIRVNTSNYDYFYLCAELRAKRMIPVLMRIRAKTLEEFGELIRHPGEEYLFVVEGRVTLHTEFYDPVELGTGESIYIDSNMGHACVTAKGCREASVLGICSSDDEHLLQALYAVHGSEEPKLPAPSRLELIDAAKSKLARIGTRSMR